MNLNEKALEAARYMAPGSTLAEAAEIADPIIAAYLSALVPADVSALVERLETDEAYLRGRVAATLHTIANDVASAASLIQSQAARIDELEAGLREIDRHNDSPIKYDSHLNSIVERLLNGERKG